MSDRLGFRLEDVDEELNKLASAAVDSVFMVRKELGAGLLEDIYRLALVYELRSRGLEVECSVPLYATYKGIPLGKAYQADVIVERQIVLELKAVETLHPAHEAQLLTYMHLAKVPLGFLVNFNAVPLADGIRRRVLSRSRLRVFAANAIGARGKVTRWRRNKGDVVRLASPPQHRRARDARRRRPPRPRRDERRRPGA